MGQNDVDVKVKLTAMSSGLKEMANQLKELGGLKKESDMFAKAATNIAASIAVVNNIAGQGEVNTFKQYVASVEASFNKLSNIGAKLSKFRKILNEDMASIDLRDKNIDKNIVTIDEYKSMNSGQNVAIARQKVMSEQREMFPRLNKIDDTRLASYKSISKLTDAQVEKDYAAYVETKKAQIQTDLSNLEELRQTAFELYKLEKEVLKEELVEEKNKLRILKETHEKRLKGKTSQAEDWESPEEEDEARRIAESEKNKLRQDREIEAAKDVEIELRERANAQTQRDIELKQKVEKELRQDEALARKQFKEQVNLAKYNEKVGVMPSGLAPSNVALSSSQSQLDVAGVEKELNTRVQILKQLQAETKEKERQVGLVKNEEELQAKMLEYRQALEREEYGKASVKEARTVLNTVKEQTKEFKTQESIKAKRGAIGSPDLPISNEKLIDAAQQGNVEVVRQDLENRKQILEIAKLNVLEAQKELSLAKTKEEISKASINEQQARVNQAHVEKDVALAKEQLKIAEKTAQVKKQEQEDIQKTDEIMKRAHNRITDLGGASKKIDFHTAQLEVARLNADLKEIPQHLRKAKAEELAKTLKAAGINAHQVGSELKLAAAGSKKLEGQLKKSLKEFFSMEKLIQRITFVITATLSYKAFQMFINGIKAAININIQFRDELGKTFALIAGASDVKKLQLTESVAGLAKKYRMELKDVSEAFYQIISAQFNVSEAMKVLDASLKLAVGGFANANDAALALVQTLNAFELGANKASHVADVMFETTRLGIITTQQYADQMSKVASTASMFGISIEEVSAAISVMTRNGVKVDQAFTSLNQLLMTIANPTEEAKKTMDAYGVSLDMNKVRSEGLVNSLLSLGDVLKSEEAMTNIVKSRTGAKAMFSLVQNSEDYITDLLAMYDSVGAAEEAANERLNTTASLLKQSKSSMTELGRQLGQELEPTIAGLYVKLNSLINTAIRILPYLINAVKGLAIQVSFLAGKAVLMKAVSLFKQFGSVPKILQQIKIALGIVKVEAVAAGDAAKGAAAGATGGLSILLGLLIQVGAAIYTAFRAGQTKGMQDELDSLNSKIEKYNQEMEKLDSQIASLHGMNDLLTQTENLGKNMGDNTQKQEQFNKHYEALQAAVSTMINTNDLGADKFANIHTMKMRLLDKEIAKNTVLVNVLLARNAAEVRQNIVNAKKYFAEDENSSRIGTDFSRFRLGSDGAKGASQKIDLGFAYVLAAEGAIGKIQKPSLNGTPEQKAAEIKAYESRVNVILSNLDTQLINIKVQSNRLIAEDYGNMKLLSNARKKAEKELDTAFNTLTSLSTDLRDNLSVEKGIYAANIMDSVNESYDTKVTEPAKSAAAKKAEKEIKDRRAEFIDKYLDLFRKIGFEVESKFIDSFTDIKRNIQELIKKDVDILPSEDTIKVIDELAGMLAPFANINQLVNKKAYSINDVKENYDAAQEYYNTLVANLTKIDEVSQNLITRGNAENTPEMVAMGVALAGMYKENLRNTEMQLSNSLEEMLNKYSDNFSKSNQDTIDISRKILEEVYPDWNRKVADANTEELKDMLEDNLTPDPIKIAIQDEIKKRNKVVTDTMRILLGKYGIIMDEFKDGFDDIIDVFNTIKTKLKKFGISNKMFDRIFRVITEGTQEQFAEMEKTLAEEYQRVYAEPLAAISNAQALVMVDEGLLENYRLAKESKNRAIINAQSDVESKSKVIKTYSDDVYASVADKLAKAWGGKSAKAPEFATNEERDKYIKEKILAIKETSWTGWGDIKNIPQDATTEQMMEAYWGIHHDLKRKSMTQGAQVAREEMDGYAEAKARLETYLNDMSNLDEKIADTEESLIKHKENLAELKSKTPEKMFDLLALSEEFKKKHPDYELYTDKEKRKSVYEWQGQTPAQKELDQIPEMKGPEIGDAILEGLNINEPITIGEAMDLVGGKATEVANQLYQQYWDNKIKIAEEAKEKLLEIENNREKMMLNNQNLSDEQKLKMQEQFEARRRQIEKKAEKEIGEMRKKQAITDLTIEYAKGIAEIWIREVASKGGAGIATATILTALMSGLFAVQLSMIKKQEYWTGGYTGQGGRYEPAGVVHKGELVIDKPTMDKNFWELMGLYNELRSGKTFAQAVNQYKMATKDPQRIISMSRTANVPAYANGGYVGKQLQFNEPINVMVNFQGMRVLDDIDINIMAEQGGRKRRVIRG